nr:hypothetical protein [Tanacetum cinerariifolium]
MPAVRPGWRCPNAVYGTRRREAWRPEAVDAIAGRWPLP